MRPIKPKLALAVSNTEDDLERAELASFAKGLSCKKCGKPPRVVLDKKPGFVSFRIECCEV